MTTQNTSNLSDEEQDLARLQTATEEFISQVNSESMDCDAVKTSLDKLLKEYSEIYTEENNQHQISSYQKDEDADEDEDEKTEKYKELVTLEFAKLHRNIQEEDETIISVNVTSNKETNKTSSLTQYSLLTSEKKLSDSDHNAREAYLKKRKQKQKEHLLIYLLIYCLGITLMVAGILAATPVLLGIGLGVALTSCFTPALTVSETDSEFFCMDPIDFLSLSICLSVTFMIVGILVLNPLLAGIGAGIFGALVLAAPLDVNEINSKFCDEKTSQSTIAHELITSESEVPGTP